MSTGPVDTRNRATHAHKTAPLTSGPRRDGAAPVTAVAGDQANLSGATGTRPLTAAVADAQAKNPLATFGNSAVDAARSLIEGGYRYPPNLTTQYYHDPMHVGCCADFAVDSYDKAGVNVGQQMSSLGYNPHYCPSMVQYFQAHQQLISPHSRAHVGDMVFFNWDGSGTADHVAIVTKVDANGQPTQIAESSNFNQPAHLTEMNSYMLGHMIAYGRLKGAGADDGVAAQLPPITNPAPASGPSYGSGGTSAGSSGGGPASAPAGSGYDAPGAATAVPSSPSSAGDNLAELMMIEEIDNMLENDFGVSPQGAKALINAKREGKDVAEVAKELGVPASKIPQLVKAVDQASAKIDQKFGKNDLPVPSQHDAWGLDKAAGQKALEKYGPQIDQAAKKAGVDPKALAATLWMHDGFKLGADPSATIDKAAADLHEHWQPDHLAQSAMGALDPQGTMSAPDKAQTLQLFANRYAAVSELEQQPQPPSNPGG